MRRKWTGTSPIAVADAEGPNAWVIIAAAMEELTRQAPQMDGQMKFRLVAPGQAKGCPNPGPYQLTLTIQENR